MRAFHAGLTKQPAYRPSAIHSGGSLFPIAPPVCCLDIVRMGVSPRSPDAFGITVVCHDVVVVRELFLADGTLPVLLEIFRFGSFRISAGDLSSRYPLG